ncbi:MAG: enoyl-CoA hydratase/isomerase family protein, partial [Candidatus Puniceispirillaceae bacterium]
GASKFLRRLPVGAAMMMGMTGTIIGAGDAMAWSLADAHVPASAFGDLKQALIGAENEDDIAACLAKFKALPPDPDFALKQDAIDAVFTADNLRTICDAASHYPDESWHDALTSRCPTSIAVFWYLMTKCPEPDTTADAIDTDYFLAVRLTSRPDFTEGVRAVLIDKDNQPNWHPATLDEVAEDFLESIFDFTAMSPLPA